MSDSADTPRESHDQSTGPTPPTPQGEDVAWSAIGSLLSGPILWGGLGMLVDHWAGTGRVFTAIGVVVGTVTAFYIVYVRFGRDG